MVYDDIDHSDYGFKQPTKVTYFVSHETQIHMLYESRPKQRFEKRQFWVY